MTIRALTFVWFRLFEGLWRYAGIYDLSAIVAAVVTRTAMLVVVVRSEEKKYEIK